MSRVTQEMRSNVEMWLPSELLGDDFIMEEKMYRSMEDSGGGGGGGGGGGYLRSFPYDCDSNLSSSPLESEDSDADESQVDLNQHNHPLLAREAPTPVLPTATRVVGHNKAGFSTLAGSPQSPLGTWSVQRPKETYQAHSTSYNAAAWDSLCAATGRMTVSDEVYVEQHQQKQKPCGGGGCGLLGLPRKVSSPPCPVPQKNAAPIGSYSLDRESFQPRPQHYHGIQLSQLQQLRLLKQQQQLAAAWCRQNPRGNARGAANLNSHSNGANNPRGGCHPMGLGLSRPTWSVFQPQPPPCSGMRAVFLGGSGAGGRKQSSGTGVFLPRRVGSSTEPRKKPACSTVLVPAKVVQALNLNLEEMGGVVGGGGHPNPGFHSRLFLEHDIMMNGRNGATVPVKRVGPVRPTTTTQLPGLAMSHHHCQEIHLPSEWTY